jgi:hypothetical protein
MWIGFLFLSFLFIIVEAYIESIHGDKRHWTSVVISFGLYSAFALTVSRPEYIFLLAGSRCFFDLVYNKFDNQEWYYQGSSETDKVLRKLDKHFVLALRVIGFVVLSRMSLMNII